MPIPSGYYRRDLDRGKAVTHKEVKKMKRLSGGIDVGSESHHITILDEEDKFL